MDPWCGMQSTGNTSHTSTSNPPISRLHLSITINQPSSCQRPVSATNPAAACFCLHPVSATNPAAICVYPVLPTHPAAVSICIFSNTINQPSSRLRLHLSSISNQPRSRLCLSSITNPQSGGLPISSHPLSVHMPTHIIPVHRTMLLST